VRIKVKPIGLIRNYLAEHDRSVPAGCTARTLIREFGIPGELKMVVFINGKMGSLDAELRENDEIKLVTLATGG
jgi:sulfur carrier protein ThiS